MVHRCCISSCGMNVRVAEAKGLSYHGFPNKEPLRAQWIQAVVPHLDKPESFKVVPKYTRVCSRHFRKKDYSVDIKKRARLNSNAVPSVFPRKNTPIIIPNVLATSPKCSKSKGETTSPILTSSAAPTPTNASTISTTIVVSNSCHGEENNLITNSSPVLTPLTWTMRNHSDDGTSNLDSSSLPREFVIESATLTDDQLTLTVLDNESVSVSSLSQEDQSQSLSLNEDSNEAPQKKRKRRKWNRTAFDRPPKGKKKVSDESNIDGVGEALAEISLSTLLAIAAPELQDRIKEENCSHNSTTTTSVVSELTNVLQTVSLPLDNVTVQNMPPDQVQHLSSIEQELLQSIQAVSLHCAEAENIESHGLSNSDQNVLSLGNPIPAFLHHHSSEESLFSNEDDLAHHVTHFSMTNRTTSPTESDLSHIVGLGLDERSPTVLEIDNLANHFNTSLLTTTAPITLSIELRDLHLPRTDTLESETPSISTSSSVEDNLKCFITHTEVAETEVAEEITTPKPPIPIRKKKAPEEVRLTGVTKKHKKEKMCGRFSVERFSHSDKDIEYYTGFTSFKNFEAFFRSLEAYVERLRVTDVMFGVTNLDKLNSESADTTGKLAITTPSGTLSEFVSPLPPPPALDEPQKRRPFNGRSMSRIDELFMTVIRLKRKLPEKVLGHMFCISQPTVSRIIRAWTVLLSKLIDCYPVENYSDKSKNVKPGCKSNSEHSYTSRGLGIPESFRQLFHCELAKSIVVTSVTAKDKKINLSKNNVSISKRSKKSRLEDEYLFLDSTTSSTNPSSVASFIVDPEDCTNSNSNSSLMFNPCGDLETEQNEFFQAVDFL